MGKHVFNILLRKCGRELPAIVAIEKDRQEAVRAWRLGVDLYQAALRDRAGSMQPDSALLKPKSGDCCVFCSYGDVPCPPIQEARSGSLRTSCCE
jgi:hypothetical protein